MKLFFWTLLLASAWSQEPPGRALYSAAGCQACHRVGETGGNAGPDLTMVGVRRSRAWLELWLSHPAAWKPDTLMPDFKLPPKTLQAIVDYLAGLKGQEYRERSPWDGRAVYARAGCVACHGPQGRGGHPNNNVAGGAIPGLSSVAETFTLDELKEKIRRGVLKPEKADPHGPEPLVFMPAWREIIKESEIDAVASYLMALGKGQKTSDW